MRVYFKALRRTKGFSLLEAIIAIGLIMVLLSAFLSVWLAAGLNISIQRAILAEQIASREIETIRAKSFSEIVSTTTPITDALLGELPGGTGTTTISDYLATSTIKHIEVLVTWRERGATKQYRLNTLVTSGGTNP